jgi:hypothetical protein
VSLLSDQGVPVEEIARLVGHSSTATTELVYRKQIRPIVQTGAIIMDVVFGSGRHSNASAKKPGSSGEEPGCDQRV